MAWRIVKQPNNKLARFSDIVDDFTDFNLSEEDAIEMCIKEYSMNIKDAKEKVKRGMDSPQRWDDEIETINAVHGKKRAQAVVSDLSNL